MKSYLFTSDAVTEGHPDKLCDKISDTILDEALAQNKNSRMAVEATIKDDLILIYEEMDSTAKIDFEKIAKKKLKDVGYEEEYNVITKIGVQSTEISEAVTKKNVIGAGDQGIMFGFACDDTEVLMPVAIYYTNKLAKRLYEVSSKNEILMPDGKAQVTVIYENGVLKKITNIVVSTQHIKGTTKEYIENLVINEVINKVIPSSYISDDIQYLINPSGSFVKVESFGDSGTTGRKIVCDTYGGYGRVGGVCLLSKNPTKVDRSAAYYCRYVANSILANNLASKCEIGVSYAIGKSEPMSLTINTFGTNKYLEEMIEKTVKENFDFSVTNIIKELNLNRPIYAMTANYGHFGNDIYPWENIKKIKCLQ